MPTLITVVTLFDDDGPYFYHMHSELLAVLVELLELSEVVVLDEEYDDMW